MSNSLEQKLRSMRKAEGLTQKAMAEMTGISLGTIRNYETGFNTVGIQTVQTILNTATFSKYTMWLMTGQTAPKAGQVAPALSPDGQENGSTAPKTPKAG